MLLFNVNTLIMENDIELIEFNIEKDCNDFLKTRKGLQLLIEDFGKGSGCSVDYPVEFAVHMEHLMWGQPPFE